MFQARNRLATLRSPLSTGGKRLLSSRIDVHTHVVPSFWGEKLSTYGGDPSGWALPKWEEDSTLRFMDELNIQTKVLSVTAPGTTAWPDKERPDMVRRINEYVQNLTVKHPGRFGNFASLPLPDVDAAVKEIKYALDELKADGVVLYSNYNGSYLGDKKFDKVWKALDERNATVFIHPSYPPLQYLEGQPGPLVDYPFDSARNAVHMVQNGVLRNYKNVKIILSHGGGFVPYTVLRFVELGALVNPNSPPKEQLLEEFKKFYYDTALASGPYAIPLLKKFCGIDHILFGSDYPYASHEVASHFTNLLDKGSDITSADVDAINGNAAKLFTRFSS